MLCLLCLGFPRQPGQLCLVPHNTHISTARKETAKCKPSLGFAVFLNFESQFQKFLLTFCTLYLLSGVFRNFRQKTIDVSLPEHSISFRYHSYNQHSVILVLC